MSDYLGNLVTRTLLHAAVVRPQLPSLFEPSAASGRRKSESEFEQETFSESRPITQHSETTAANPPSILAPGQTLLRESESIPPRASRRDRILSAAEDIEPSPEDAVPRPASKSRESRSTPVQAETKVEPVTPELRGNDSRAAQRERSPRTPDSQPKSPSLVRPALPLQKIRAVEAVVPASRSLPQFPSTTSPAPAPTINVTIGRVEIRATSPPPPPPPRARPKAANVLSLEDYLRQRAKGGGR